MMKDRDFEDISKVLKRNEGEFLLPGLIQRGATSGSFLEALKIFSRPPYNFAGVATISHGDDLLRQKLEEAYSLAYKGLPYPQVVDILACRYEFDSLKTALFRSYTTSPQPPIYLELGNILWAEYQEFFVHQDPFKSKLPDYLLKPAQKALQLIKEGETPTKASQIFMSRMYGHMTYLAGEVGNQYIKNLVGVMIDFHNTYALLEARDHGQDITLLQESLIEGGNTSTSYFLTGYTRPVIMAVPPVYHKNFKPLIQWTVDYYEQTEELATFAHLFRHIQQSQVMKADAIDFGPEIPFSYILKKEYEIAQLRTVLYGKWQGTPEKVLLKKLNLA